MATGVRDQYNVAINGKGYMLRGTPQSPGYRRDEVPTSVSRLALSDLQYSDFSGAGTFFVAQTDWSAGVKRQKTWADDAKYYYSTNIDAFSEPGCFKLLKDQTTDNNFAEQIACGGVFEVNGSTNQYVGTYDDGNGRPQIYKYSGSWSVVGSNPFGTQQNLISQMISHKNKLWALTVGVGNTHVVQTYDGSSFSDKSSTIIGVLSGGYSAMGAARAGCELAGTLYIGCDSASNNATYIVSTDDEGSSFTEEVYLKTDSLIIDMCAFNGQVYYMLASAFGTEVRVFDPTTSSDTSVGYIAALGGSGLSFYAEGGRLMFVQDGKLVITVAQEIYEFDGNSLTRIWEQDPAKNAIGLNADTRLYYGGCQNGSIIYWGNLVYTQGAFHNYRKDDDDNNFFIPLYADTTTSGTPIKGYSFDDNTILLKDQDSGGDPAYKPTLANNFIVFSEMSQVVSIDKILVSIAIVFDPIAANESIAVEYSTNGGSSWTALDTMTFNTEGSTATKRTFTIPNSVLYSKLFVRVKLGTSTLNSTPTVRDVIVGYKPTPDYKNRWQMRLEMSNGVKLLNNQSEQRTGADLIAGMWNEKVNKQTVTFEDIDYVETTLVSGMTASQTSALVKSTKGLPRAGRIRAVSGGVAEEMTYTSAEINKIKGITRSRRGTKGRAYSAGQQIDTGYTVYIDKVGSELNFTDENKTEHIATVTLLEA